MNELTEQDHRPWPVPKRPWIMVQVWRDTLFAHWNVSPAAIRPLVPHLKQQFIDAQVVYFDGKTPGVTDGAVVDAISSLATAFETPDYGRVSLLQVQYVHGRVASQIVPTLFRPTSSLVRQMRLCRLWRRFT